MPDTDAIDQDFSFVNVMEPAQKIDGGGLDRKSVV
jgi:hypothetical protein